MLRYRPPGRRAAVDVVDALGEVAEANGATISSVRLHQPQGFPEQEICIVQHDGSAIVPIELPTDDDAITVEFTDALL